MLTRRGTFRDLFREMNRLQDEFGRAFYERGVNPLLNGGPAINVLEEGDNVFAEMDLPGIDPSKLDVSVTEGNQLTVQGERTAEEIAGAVWHRQECFSGTFTRVVTLPTLVDADKVEATYDAGVLKLTMPKADAAKPRKIAIKGV
ncbi:MAG: Hsp20/alpha crystallin family protein [Gemmataceae bacterium]